MRLSDFIPHVYEPVLDAGRWQDTLDGLLDRLDATAGAIASVDSAEPEVSLDVVSKRLSDSPEFKHYAAKLQEEDSRTISRLLRSPAGRLIYDDDFLGDSLYGTGDRTGLWLRENFGVRCRVALRLESEGAWNALLVMHLPEEAAIVRQSEIGEVLTLAPHLARAIEIARPFHLLKSRFAAVLGVLDRFHLGVVILDGAARGDESRIVVTNRSAERVLERRDGLMLTGAKSLSARGEETRLALDRALEAAAKAARADSDDRGTLLAVPRGPGQDPYLLDVSPLAAGAASEIGRFRGVLVLIVDPDATAEISIEGLRAFFGLTETEETVGRLFVAGHSYAEIADIRGVAFETAKSQVRSLLAKTGATDRSAFVRTAAKFSLPVDRKDEENGA